jgi:MSHA type pilus biogenesis protein MshL
MTNLLSSIRNHSRLTVLALTVFLALTGCAETGLDEFLAGDPIDRKMKLSREDYDDFYDWKDGKNSDSKPKASSLAPELAPVLAAPRPPKIGETKLVSLAVTDDVPLKDVLIELSKLADVDLELDANINGGIAFRAKNRPFSEVIDRISDLAGLRYKYAGGVLRVERDLPYIQNYPLDFLNMVRSSNSSMNISTDILALSGTGEGGGGAGGLSSGSAVTIDAKAEDDFWKSLESNVTSILMHKAPNYLSGQPVAPEEAIAPPAAGAVVLGENMFYVINRQAGILSVAASEQQHVGVSQYLEFLKRNATSQVLIEAKVVEVELNRQFQSGIDWNLVQQNIGSGTWNVGTTFTEDFDVNNVVNFALNPNDPNANINAVLNLTERFGTTRTLSSPRLHAINNQPAVLTFAENRIFFDIDVQQGQVTTVNGVSQTQPPTITSTPRSIPIGIILNILPSINLDKNEVTLSVRPTLTRQIDQVADPTVPLLLEINGASGLSDNISNNIPIVEVRELDSIMKLRSGQVMVIGGLMEESSNNVDNGVPFLSGIPFLGNAFKAGSKSSTNSELIIFIRASIVSPQGSYQEADKRVYEKFSDDPRPIAF